MFLVEDIKCYMTVIGIALIIVLVVIYNYNSCTGCISCTCYTGCNSCIACM